MSSRQRLQKVCWQGRTRELEPSCSRHTEHSKASLRSSCSILMHLTAHLTSPSCCKEGERHHIKANAHTRAWYQQGKVGNMTWRCLWSWYSSPSYLQMFLNEQSINIPILSKVCTWMEVSKRKLLQVKTLCTSSWVICQKWEEMWVLTTLLLLLPLDFLERQLTSCNKIHIFLWFCGYHAYPRCVCLSSSPALSSLWKMWGHWWSWHYEE